MSLVIYLYAVSTAASLPLLQISGIFHILIAGLKIAASAMILAHNHRSGSTTASRADQGLARKIHQAAALMDIRVLDHVILTLEGFYSFAEKGDRRLKREERQEKKHGHAASLVGLPMAAL